MKTRIAILIIAILLLLFTILSQDVTGEEIANAISLNPIRSTHLTNMFWEVDGMTSGGNYQLVVKEEYSPVSGGCCCNYLPCVINNMP